MENGVVQFDHLVHWVPSLDAAVQGYRALGFTVQSGGRHSGSGTHNAAWRLDTRYIELIAVCDVLYFQSDTKYTRVVLAGSEALIRTPLKELLADLDPDRFWQVHRGTIVNVDAVSGVVREDAGPLSDGSRSGRCAVIGGPHAPRRRGRRVRRMRAGSAVSELL